MTAPILPPRTPVPTVTVPPLPIPRPATDAELDACAARLEATALANRWTVPARPRSKS